MTSYLVDSFWYYLGYEEEVEPHPTTLKVRPEMLKQIKNSKLKLKKIEELNCEEQVEPVKAIVKKKNKKANKKADKKADKKVDFKKKPIYISNRKNKKSNKKYESENSYRHLAYDFD